MLLLLFSISTYLRFHSAKNGHCQGENFSQVEQAINSDAAVAEINNTKTEIELMTTETSEKSGKICRIDNYNSM